MKCIEKGQKLSKNAKTLRFLSKLGNNALLINKEKGALTQKRNDRIYESFCVNDHMSLKSPTEKLRKI